MLLDTAVRVLAASRMTRLVTEDQITAPLREKAFDVDPNGKHLGYLVTCTACTSMYAGTAAVMLPRKVALALAISEAVILLRQKLDSGHGAVRL